jgi:hypothetical protein
MSDFSPPPLPPEPPPPEPPPPEPPHRQGIPWDDRERLGLPTAFVETLKKVVVDPVGFFRAMPVSGGLGGPLVYGMLIGYFGVVVSAFYQAILQSLGGGGMMGELARRGDFERYAEHFGGLLGFVFALVLGPVFLLIALFVGAGITHLALMLLGGAKRDFEATFRVACFAQSGAVLAVVPFCGQLVQGIYQIVLTIIGLAEAHQISRWTAAGAVFLPIVLFCCCCGVTAGMMFGGLAGLAGGLPR